MQALSVGHSELVTHSGLQPGGLPLKFARHVQTAIWLLTRHWLLGPQKELAQGSVLFA